MAEEHARLLEGFPARGYARPDGLHMEWDGGTSGDVWFSGWVGAAGEAERDLLAALGRFEDVEAEFADERGYAHLRVLFHYEDMTPEYLSEVLRVLAGYRVNSGYLWVEYCDVESE